MSTLNFATLYSRALDIASGRHFLCVICVSFYLDISGSAPSIFPRTTDLCSLSCPDDIRASCWLIFRVIAPPKNVDTYADNPNVHPYANEVVEAIISRTYLSPASPPIVVPSRAIPEPVELAHREYRNHCTSNIGCIARSWTFDAGPPKHSSLETTQQRVRRVTLKKDPGGYQLVIYTKDVRMRPDGQALPQELREIRRSRRDLL
ncbi:Baeyer-Villiger monooxygenase [Fusarium oxysporum f. sp. albedinis]|nr:Baeyer-Villiger monooxygenase [Fusarium oxysporum f. sp. albedinis]